MLSACWRKPETKEITLYSGRSQHLLAPLLEEFMQETGIRVQTRYGGTAELAATILEEGARSPADLFFAQDAGALGALSKAGRFRKLPDDIINKVPVSFRSPQNLWVGTSGRARVLIYNPDRIQESDLPDDIMELTDAAWRERLGWAPLNASFQAFVTALRVERGDEAARAWLQAMAANRPRSYARNTAIVLAVASGEIDIGLTNHYYLHTMQKEQDGQLRAANYVPRKGTLINVAGVGILQTSRHPHLAETLLQFLLSERAQRFFTDQTYEYPLVAGITANPVLPDLQTIPATELDLSMLEDLDSTLKLLQELGIL